MYYKFTEPAFSNSDNIFNRLYLKTIIKMSRVLKTWAFESLSGVTCWSVY